MVMNLIFLAGLAVVGIVLLIALDALVRRPVMTTRLVLIAVVLGTMVADRTVLTLNLAGFAITLEDVIFGLVTGAAAIRYLRVRRTSSQQKFLLGFGGVLVVSLIFGIASVGLAPSVNEFRTYLAFAGVALYFSTVQLDLDLRKAMAREWMWAGIALGSVVVVRWLARFGGFGLGIFDDPSAGATLRVINGPDTLTIATIALVLLLPGLSSTALRYDRQSQVGAALLLIAVMLNRRTLWLALAIVVAVLIVRDRRVGRKITVFATTGVVLFGVAVLLLGQGASDDVALSATDTDNLGWRVEGWVALLESGPSQIDEYVIGLPFGSGYDREVRGTQLDLASPHNYYLQAYLRTGLIGVAALIATIVTTAMALAKYPPGSDPNPFAQDHLFLLLILMGIWLLAWSPLAEQGIILGMAVASVTYQRYRRPLVPKRPVDVLPFDVGTETQR